jgi:outer membrane biosynthesis protein TonB
VSLFKKKSSEFDEQENQGSGKSSGSLIVLLVLLGGFAYLYFFTSLIVPHEAPSAKAPEVSTEVKQSMPPKPGSQPVNPVTTEAKKPEEAKPAAPATPPAQQPQAAGKTAAPAAPKQEAAAPVKNAEPKTAAKAAEQKAAPVVQKKEEAKSVKTAAPVAEKPVARKKPEAYTIFAGEFPAGEETAAAEAKLARLGIKPVDRQEIKKSKSMNRLFFGAYTDYDLYSAELNKLRQSAKGAFGVEKDGKYYLYAGSFSAKERVEKEKRDLAAKGITLQTQLVTLPLSTVRLTAGRFAAKGEAEKAAAKMKSEGLTVKVVQLGR